jgi:outer membrane protein TolC
MRWTVPLIFAGYGGLAMAAPLSFTSALDLAERQSPALAANVAQIGAAQSMAVPAGALPDPKLVAGLDNFDVSGADRWRPNGDFMTMQRIGVMQEFPNSEKRRAREEVATAGIDVAQTQGRVVRLQVRRDTALAWLNRYYLEQKLAIFDELEDERQALAVAVKARIAGGQGQASDALLPMQEEAQLGDRRDDLARDIAKAKASLRRFVGSDADEALAGEPPTLEVDPVALHRHVHAHPELRIFEAQLQKTSAEVREAKAAKKSDWGVELDFQRRAPQFGNMVSVQFTFDLPFFPARRQDPLIAAKERDLDRIDAEREAMLREHTNALDNDLADLAALSSQLDRARNTSLTLAREKVDLQAASYQSGKGELIALLDARRELIDARLRVIDLEGQRAAVAATLKFAYGEIAP